MAALCSNIQWCSWSLVGLTALRAPTLTKEMVRLEDTLCCFLCHVDTQSAATNCQLAPGGRPVYVRADIKEGWTDGLLGAVRERIYEIE